MRRRRWVALGAACCLILVAGWALSASEAAADAVDGLAGRLSWLGAGKLFAPAAGDLHSQPRPTLDPRAQAEAVAAAARWGFPHEVAFVYTWVNGSDRAYRELRQQHGGQSSVGTSRDRDNGELRYSLRSLARYLPWSRGAIYLVTPNAQVPYWLNASHPRIRIVAQETLFPRPEDLPSFSSNAVEEHLWRIPGLTPTFVHMNDDYFFGEAVAPADLFTASGGSRLFFESSTIKGTRAQAAEYERKHAKVWLSSTINTNALLTDTYGEATRHYLKHAPFVYQKEAVRRVHERWPVPMQATSARRFRHWQDVITPLLHHYVLIHEGDALGLSYEIAPDAEMRQHTGFLILADDTNANANLLKRIRTGKAPRFYTLNDGFNKPNVANLIATTLAAALPDPCEFERTDAT